MPRDEASYGQVNVLLSSGGRRSYLAKWFREALAMNHVGGRVIVADADRYAAAQAFADEFIVAPRISESIYTDWLKDVLTSRAISLAISVNDFELSEWSRLDGADASLAPLIRLPADTQHVVEDKLSMAERYAHAGIHTPKTQLAGSLFSAECRDQVVVKGRFGSGSRGLALATAETLATAIARAQRQVTDRAGRVPANDSEALEMVVVQPRIQGQEFGLDVINNLAGEHVTVLARRKVAMRGGETDHAVAVDPEPFREIGRRIAGLIRHRGLIDVDVIVDEEGRARVIDLNPRFGGGYPFSHVAGAHIPAAYVAWALGRTAQPDWLVSSPGVAATKFIDLAVVDGGV